MFLIMRLLVVLLVMRLLLLMLLCLPCVAHTMDLMFWMFFVAAVSQRAALSPYSMLLQFTDIGIVEYLVSWSILPIHATHLVKEILLHGSSPSKVMVCSKKRPGP